MLGSSSLCETRGCLCGFLPTVKAACSHSHDQVSMRSTAGTSTENPERAMRVPCRAESWSFTLDLII